jgi:hypothetical protein
MKVSREFLEGLAIFAFIMVCMFLAEWIAPTPRY